MRHHSAGTFRRLVQALAIAAGTLNTPAMAAAEFVLQGSTTVNSELMREYQPAIETAANLKLTIIPNKSNLGLAALLEGTADLAMTSTPLANELDGLRRLKPGLPLDRFKQFEIARTRASLIVHPSNPVRAISDADLQGVLSGKITNWSTLGGADEPIRIVAVREGGGVIATVEAYVFGAGGHITNPNQIRLQNGPEIVTVVEQEPAALGITQHKLIVGRHVIELTTSHPIAQPLFLVSLGDPSTVMQSVIDACTAVAAQAGLD